ncbi:PIG-L family deacetylase [Dechloromonas sp. XY25]|uniref:PIG-L family deacetylase n=1 Tax=Dechloromonas hankyongensis TaxID=2908002 RepID=A0ABS9K6F6_9RHOO|nr:PIG-L family deacetylase [Dechloromonas hankyongensis]MCG2578726.1 PIG-L family deacetylase [Dechloromonas hankyongensis]
MGADRLPAGLGDPLPSSRAARSGRTVPHLADAAPSATFSAAEFPTDARQLGRLLFISPHLDDAVFACGRLLASAPEAIVATVFAASPAPGSALTEWDRASGFASGDEAVACRREEDRQALAALDAWPLWLDLPDSQYAPLPPLAAVVDCLRRLLFQCEPQTVFFPLGLFHSDHRLTREAVLTLLPACSGCHWFAYEDALYRCLPGQREAGMTAVVQTGLAPYPARFAETADAAGRKRRAVACYESQLRALATPGRPGHADLTAGEIYWRIGGAQAAGNAAS